MWAGFDADTQLSFSLCLSFSFFFQKEMPDVMRQGMDEMIRFDKKPEKMRVYTYENAVKRCFICSSIKNN